MKLLSFEEASVLEALVRHMTGRGQTTNVLMKPSHELKIRMIQFKIHKEVDTITDLS